MSVLDSIIYSIKCNACSNEESIKLLDKGSIYSGSCWQSGYESIKFNIIWSGGYKEIPYPEVKLCNMCGSKDISVDSHFKV